MYRHKLKETVKDKLMRYKGNINTPNALIKASVELDDKLYKQTMEKCQLGGNSFRAGP